MRDVHINECMNHYFELDLFIFLHSFFEDWPVQFSFCPLWKYIRVSDDKNFIFGLSISLSNTTGMMSMIPGEMGRKLLWFKKKKKSWDGDFSGLHVSWEGHFPLFYEPWRRKLAKLFSPFLSQITPSCTLSNINFLPLFSCPFFHLLSWNKWKKDSMIYSSLCLIHSWRYVFYLSDKSI